MFTAYLLKIDGTPNLWTYFLQDERGIRYHPSTGTGGYRQGFEDIARRTAELWNRVDAEKLERSNAGPLLCHKTYPWRTPLSGTAIAL